jgi:hypothetical protein
MITPQGVANGERARELAVGQDHESVLDGGAPLPAGAPTRSHVWDADVRAERVMSCDRCEPGYRAPAD